ncbi:MAG: hypothetical protein EOS42_16020, partial [Mesorhizobium sp.]
MTKTAQEATSAEHSLGEGEVCDFGRMLVRTRWRDSAPLCPAGHLPHKGVDQQLCGRLLSCNVDSWRRRRRHPISPQVGEMS